MSIDESLTVKSHNQQIVTSLMKISDRAIEYARNKKEIERLRIAMERCEHERLSLCAEGMEFYPELSNIFETLGERKLKEYLSRKTKTSYPRAKVTPHTKETENTIHLPDEHGDPVG